MSFYIKFQDGTYFGGFERRVLDSRAAIKMPIEIALNILGQANGQGQPCKLMFHCQL
jgi:hypothetical protein